MAEASSSSKPPVVGKAAEPAAATATVNVDELDKLLAQEESAFQRDLEVSLIRQGPMLLTIWRSIRARRCSFTL